MANEQNLKPFPKGVSGNPAGRPKGIKNWSTIVQQILGDEKLMDKVMKNKPSYWNELPGKNAANAIVMAMAIKALQGDKQAAEWIRKTGFGDKVDVTSMGDRITTAPIIISAITPRNVEAETETTTND